MRNGMHLELVSSLRTMPVNVSATEAVKVGETRTVYAL